MGTCYLAEVHTASDEQSNSLQALVVHLTSPFAGAEHSYCTISAIRPRSHPANHSALHTIACKGAAPHIYPHRWNLGADIEIENIHRQTERCAGIRDVNDTRNVALDRCAAEQQIDLVIAVAVAAEVLNRPETGLSVCDCRIEEVLLSLLVDREPLESKVSSGPVMWLHRAWQVNGRLHAHLRHAVLDHGEFDCDDAGHFDRPAE
jgi:hypothetical protein